jgi:hypothetical protein
MRSSIPDPCTPLQQKQHAVNVTDSIDGYELKQEQGTVQVKVSHNSHLSEN